MNTIILIIVLLAKNLLMLNSLLTEEINTNLKTPKFKRGDKVKITIYKYILSNVYIKKRSREIFVIDSMLKTNPWTYRIKDSIREKNNKLL